MYVVELCSNRQVRTLLSFWFILTISLANETIILKISIDYSINMLANYTRDSSAFSAAP